MPEEVKDGLGKAIRAVQRGKTPGNAKRLHGYGSGVLEIIEDFDGDTYRAVYAVRFRGVVYVLVVFQKKSKRRMETPKHILDLIHDRLRWAEQDYAGTLIGREG